MADFTAIFNESPYKSIHDAIDMHPEGSLRVSLARLRNQEPDIALSPLLCYCVEREKMAPFVELLESGISPDEHVVEASAMKENSSFLLELLDRGWPINHTLQRGRVPSLLCLAIDRPTLLEELLRRGASPNAMSTSGETALSVAVQAGSLRTIKMLLNAGADVQNSDVLHYAIEREGDELEVMRLLLSHNAPVNTVQFAHPIARQLRHSLSRGTPLHKACLLGKHEAAGLLLLHGAKPNSTRRRESQVETTTPLDIARQRGDEHMVALLEAGEPKSRI